jgi:hypothetical protein
MIEKLTKEQEAKLVEYRQRYFNQATSTERADRERAEKAARRLAELGGVKINEVFWVDSPEEGEEKYDSLGGSLMDSLWDSLWGSLKGSLKGSLWDSLRNSLWVSLRGSLRGFLRDYLWGLLRESPRGSLIYSLWDTTFVAFATFVVEELGIEINTEDQEKLHVANEILSSCFALWVVPGGVILCERPKSFEVEDGKLINAEW